MRVDQAGYVTSAALTKFILSLSAIVIYKLMRKILFGVRKRRQRNTSALDVVSASFPLSLYALH